MDHKPHSAPLRSRMAKVWSMWRPAARLQAGMIYFRHRSYSCRRSGSNKGQDQGREPWRSHGSSECFDLTHAGGKHSRRLAYMAHASNFQS